jgi:hypothetical protein
MINSITRKLEDGADYSPDWRHQVVLEHLKSHATGGGMQSIEKLLDNERDVVVRQVVRYHLKAGCLITQAVRYARICQQKNASTGLASTLRAMMMAGFEFDVIAAQLKTDRLNIRVFAWLYFDIERYLDHVLWLESLLRRDFCPSDRAAGTRERRLLRIAYDDGPDALLGALRPGRTKTSEDAQNLAGKVRHAVAARALEFVQDLDDRGVPASPEDFQRHLLVEGSAGVSDLSDKGNGTGTTWKEWFDEAIAAGVFPDDVARGIVHGPAAYLTQQSWTTPTEESDGSHRPTRTAGGLRRGCQDGNRLSV